MLDKPKPCAECGATPSVEEYPDHNEVRVIAECVTYPGEECWSSNRQKSRAIAQWNKMQEETNV